MKLPAYTYYHEPANVPSGNSNLAPNEISSNSAGSGTKHAPKVFVHKNFTRLIYALVALGIVVRLFHFFDNRSLWIDEIYLSSSLLHMNFLELAVPPLDYEQKAPILFLWAVKLGMLLFGKSELALRLFPLLCGIAALFAFVPVCRHFLSPLGAVVAMGILALAPPLIYHSVEIKQYCTEALATILALLAYMRYHRQVRILPLAVWGLAGTVLIWFSHSVIFILVGMAGAISLHHMFQKNWKALFRSFVPFSLWMASFAVNYFLFTYRHAGSDWLVIWFRAHHSFMPLHLTSAADVRWFVSLPFKVFDYPLGLSWFFLAPGHAPALRYFVSMGILPLVFLFMGFRGFLRQSKKALMLLCFPVLLALLASALEQYPFYERLLVFLAPLLILLIAKGCSIAATLFRQQSFGYYLMPLLLLAGPLANTAHGVVHTQHFAGQSLFAVGKKQYQREALLYINERVKPGDLVYVYWNYKHAYRVYKESYNLKLPAIEGSDVRHMVKNEQEYFRRLAPELKRLDGKKRVWLIYNKGFMSGIGDIEGLPEWYVTANNKQAPKMIIHRKFAEMGKETGSFQLPDASVSLFDTTL